MSVLNMQLNELASNARSALEKARLALSNLSGKNSPFLGKHGEIVYSKNNVCVHGVAGVDGPQDSEGDDVVHMPGYLTVRCNDDDHLGVTLVLQWLPNSTLEKNPSSIRCVSPTTRVDKAPMAVDEWASSGKAVAENAKSQPPPLRTDNHQSNASKITRPRNLPEEPSSTDGNVLLGVPAINLIPNTPVEFDEDGEPLRNYDETRKGASGTNDEARTELEGSSTTSGADEAWDVDEIDSSPCDDADPTAAGALAHLRFCMRDDAPIPEKFAAEHNLALATTSSATTTQDNVPGGGEEGKGASRASSMFLVNLGKMRSMRVFYCDTDLTSGQLVIASHGSQYILLHFHNGGLDKLAQLFENWNAVKARSVQNGSPSALPDRQLLIAQPSVRRDELDPEEGLYDSRVNQDLWQSYMNGDGSVHNSLSLRKTIFFASMKPELRREIWPFLLRVYPWSSTYDQRESIRNDLFITYQALTRTRIKRMSTPSSNRDQLESVESSVMKDVVRTDRRNPFYAGDNNPNLETMRSSAWCILLNYAVSKPQIGYIQGMSDLLGPVLSNIRDESLSYWCFVSLMEQTPFRTTPQGERNSMEQNLEHLRELLRLLAPDFHQYLQRLGGDAMQLMFAHRWILLCFKREFPEAASLHVWEACWTHYKTRSHFHLLVCTAIVSIYGPDILAQQLPHDEILLYFSALTQHMSAEVVMKKARGLLHQFYQRQAPIPCTLADICNHPEEEMGGHWASHTATPKRVYECRGGHLDGEPCPWAIS